jgi:hypothetical protein
MKLGDKVDPSRITPGLPPVILQAQPSGYVKFTERDEIKEFETMARQLFGIELGSIQAACETCSGGCSDDCGISER